MAGCTELDAYYRTVLQYNCLFDRLFPNDSAHFNRINPQILSQDSED